MSEVLQEYVLLFAIGFVLFAITTIVLTIVTSSKNDKIENAVEHLKDCEKAKKDINNELYTQIDINIGLKKEIRELNSKLLHYSRIKCFDCGKYVSKTKPCKHCGSIKHIKK